MDHLKELFKGQILDKIDRSKQICDEELLERIDEVILEYSRHQYLPLKDRIYYHKALFASFRKLDILQELVDDKEVTEIMVNGKEDIFVEKKGIIYQWENSFTSTEQLEDIIQQIVSRVNRIVNATSPIVDARLEDGSRVNVVLPPVAINGPILSIRKFPEPMPMDRLIENMAITQEAAEFLKLLVAAGYNIFVSGGTGSGKTTFLNALSAFIPTDQRVITIEDSAELQINQIRNLVRLETRNANAEGENEITISDLIKSSLRMRPDRIVVGEVRGREAIDMLSAMNTGHDGSLSTGHGNSPKDMLTRLETMVLQGAQLPLPAIRSQIGSAIDIMVHLGRLRDKSRRVLAIMEVNGCENGEIVLNPLYQFEETKGTTKGKVEGSLKAVGTGLKDKRKLQAAGIVL